MTDRPTQIERAFTLAASGRVETLGELRLLLRAEGYTQDGQLTGRSLRDQLVKIIAKAKTQAQE